MTALKKSLLEIGGRISEAKKDDAGRVSYPVIIISQGLGNLGDRNYYTASAIQSGVQVYEGKKAYYDHPTKSQADEQPGRSVRETCGHYENCKVVTDKDGLSVLQADFVPEKNKSEVINKLDHAIEFKKKYPTKDYIGISINGDGEGKECTYEDFVKEFNPSALEMEKISQIEGQSINAILKLTDAVSADLVTEAGAKGRLLVESKNNKRRSTMKFIEQMRKLLLGAERNDRKTIEEAVSGMLQDGGEKKDDEKAKEAAAKAEEAEAKEAAGLSKAMKQCKSEMKQEDGESEEKYEARVMKQAMKNAKKEKEDEAKKESAKDELEKKEKKESDDGDADADDKKDSKDKKDSEESKNSEADDKSDDKGHADADQDKALIKKMMKQMDELKKENEGLKKEKEAKEDESKKHQEESAKNKITLLAKERNELVDKVLSECGAPRYVTNEIRPVIERCKTKAEMKETAKQLVEAFHKVTEESFYQGTKSAFPEISNTNEKASNDALFI